MKQKVSAATNEQTRKSVLLAGFWSRLWKFQGTHRCLLEFSACDVTSEKSLKAILRMRQEEQIYEFAVFQIGTEKALLDAPK